ncbi:MAG: carboxypeptidase regulatory-like domain-containing protein [Candidatus Kapabacteria bacterium]|nr:carboxypeptidase regulatory-like domain-containing protein [Candidatus Kapabacteria bacterium]
MNTETTAAVETLLSTPYSFIRATGSGVDISETYPSNNTAVKGNFSLSGIMTGDVAEITLYFGFGSEVTHSEKVYLSKEKNLSGSGLIPRLWAQKKLAQLDMRYEDNKTQITELGKEFSIVTRNTSLIILDRVQDYIKHKIVPPDELKEEYFAAIDKEKKMIEDDSVKHIEYVLKMLEKYTKWWKKDYEFGNLKILVVDTLGEPVEGAWITIAGETKQCKSEDNGEVQFTNIFAGEHSIYVSAIGGPPLSLPIKIIADSTIQISVELKNFIPVNKIVYNTLDSVADRRVFDSLCNFENSTSSEYGTLVGQVVDEDGRPIIGATIRVEGTARGGYSKARGFVRITHIVPGDYVIRVTRIRKINAAFKMRITADSVSTFHIEMEKHVIDRDQIHVTASRLVDHGAVGSSAVISSDAMAEPSESIQSSGGSGRSTRRYLSMSSNALAPSKSKSGGSSPLASSITVKAYDSKAPYIEDLKKAGKDKFEEVYFEFKKEYGNNPGFYIDAADIATEKEMPEVALRILSNIAEMKLEDHGLLRILAQRLKQIGEYKLAVAVFREVLKIREEEPQSYRDLALALAEIDENIEAAHYMYKVVSTKWSGRFPEVELIALNELNNIYRKSEASFNPETHDPRLIANMPLDLRVVLNWDTDNCDIDLWVIDPEGEKCFYSHPRTRIGGNMSRDFTGGYGPEIYRLKKAIPGKYKIKANYYGSRTQKMTGAITLQMTLYTGYGTDKEEKKEVTLRLNDVKELVEVGEFEFGN